MEEQPESTDPEWYQDTKDPNMVWWWDGFEWAGPTPVGLALLNQLTEDNEIAMTQLTSLTASVKEELSMIRFRVGFIALVVLVSLCTTAYIIFKSAAALRGIGL